MPAKKPVNLPNPIMVRISNQLRKKLKAEGRRRRLDLSPTVREICEEFFVRKEAVVADAK